MPVEQRAQLAKERFAGVGSPVDELEVAVLLASLAS
jgi:hypothetical protein